MHSQQQQQKKRKKKKKREKKRKKKKKKEKKKKKLVLSRFEGEHFEHGYFKVCLGAESAIVERLASATPSINQITIDQQADGLFASTAHHQLIIVRIQEHLLSAARLALAAFAHPLVLVNARRQLEQKSFAIAKKPWCERALPRYALGPGRRAERAKHRISGRFDDQNGRLIKLDFVEQAAGQPSPHARYLLGTEHTGANGLDGERGQTGVAVRVMMVMMKGVGGGGRRAQVPLFGRRDELFERLGPRRALGGGSGAGGRLWVERESGEVALAVLEVLDEMGLDEGRQYGRVDFFFVVDGQAAVLAVVRAHLFDGLFFALEHVVYVLAAHVTEAREALRLAHVVQEEAGEGREERRERDVRVDGGEHVEQAAHRLFARLVQVVEAEVVAVDKVGQFGLQL
ncbi:hypothetical protein BpHYR1_042999 [Brachionus plicatilis]|uniref:Uncharacterized protein n=1 Tax=Brachionus plicatilis TaxID=10195 RepID=A0A3M7SME6_BRAPC|nr:hypothetical protein BpHYR1_042999 [Brachionus plicatilis]